MPPSEDFRRSGKRKAGADCKEEASRTPVPHPAGRHEYINIGSRWDELDIMVLGKLPAPAAIAAASVHKYWTSAFGKDADNVELTELLKLAEMYTSQGHVLNCVLYKVLAMKVDEMRSTVGRDDNADTLHAKARAIYDITKAKTIQRACVQAQKKAESQLRSCQNIIHAKDKELTKALSELSKAQGLLSKLGVPSYAYPKDALLGTVEKFVPNSQLLETEELQRTNLDLDSLKEKIKENQEKINLNKQLPYLVGSIVEASIIESLEDSSGERRSCLDADKVDALTAWHRIDCKTREALRRSFLSELIDSYEK
ncbi:R3H domain-containing protein 4 [Forsythia ovata]|uniref:R3H domain-containing protein 4 n=1 Tax=Forsythia ovata TaxID=205694 RepID=A0ABD1TRT3_9LAMI